MAVSRDLLTLLACPQCHSPVRLTGASDGIVCSKCQLLFPVEDDVPVMLVDRAHAARKAASETPSHAVSKKPLKFEVIEGRNKGLVVEMPHGTCRAIGRSQDDLENTQGFDESAVVGLDDSTMQLVLAYITKKYQGGGAVQPGASTAGSVALGSFQRLSDLSLSDNSISRLHAMIFHGAQGIGILDLVSKNGTFVNDVEVESKFLKPDDVITIGDTKIILTETWE